jgi:hypothetical protein
MAVIQISKIQQRRGQKTTNGIPQLSSAEFAWAVDSQELYIGNGSLAEGAPYVGNTRILTEHDNILELASSYRFANDDVNITYSVSRTIQSKIDEIQVSVLDFGEGDLADGSTNCAPVFSKAFQELFQNTDQKYRKILMIPNGRYLFTEVLQIPSNVIIRGETRDGVILDVNSNGIEFLSENNSEIVNFSGDDRPENVEISNITISYTVIKDNQNSVIAGGTTNITGLRNSVFNNVKFLSEYQLGDAISSVVQSSVEYDLSSIESGGTVTIGPGDTEDSTNLVSPISIIFNNNSVDTIDELISQLEQELRFNDNFVASRSAESLVIRELIPTLTAVQISEAFTVSISSEAGAIEVVPTLTEASTGVELASSAVFWRNTLFDTRVTDIKFIDCKFENNDLSIKCINDLPNIGDRYETTILFNNCEFISCDTGIFVSSPINQINDWLFKDCKFEEIFRNAIYAINGEGILVDRAVIKNCGNGLNDASTPLYSTFIFDGDLKRGNRLINCTSNRHQSAEIVTSGLKTAVPETLNSGITIFSNDYYVEIEPTPSTAFTPLAIFSSKNRFVTIDYVLTLETEVRKGQITLAINDTMTDIAILDNYTYAPSLISSSGGTLMTNFEFDAELRDNNGDTEIDTILLQYKNPSSAYGSLTYLLSYGV